MFGGVRTLGCEVLCWYIVGYEESQSSENVMRLPQYQ